MSVEIKPELPNGYVPTTVYTAMQLGDERTLGTRMQKHALTTAEQAKPLGKHSALEEALAGEHSPLAPLTGTEIQNALASPLPSIVRRQAQTMAQQVAAQRASIEMMMQFQQLRTLRAEMLKRISAARKHVFKYDIVELEGFLDSDVDVERIRTDFDALATEIIYSEEDVLELQSELDELQDQLGVAAAERHAFIDQVAVRHDAEAQDVVAAMHTIEPKHLAKAGITKEQLSDITDAYQQKDEAKSTHGLKAHAAYMKSVIRQAQKSEEANPEMLDIAKASAEAAPSPSPAPAAPAAPEFDAQEKVFAAKLVLARELELYYQIREKTGMSHADSMQALRTVMQANVKNYDVKNPEVTDIIQGQNDRTGASAQASPQMRHILLDQVYTNSRQAQFSQFRAMSAQYDALTGDVERATQKVNAAMNVNRELNAQLDGVLSPLGIKMAGPGSVQGKRLLEDEEQENQENITVNSNHSAR